MTDPTNDHRTAQAGPGHTGGGPPAARPATGPEQNGHGAGPEPGRGIFDKDLLDRCISCGFCLPACPTYALTGEETSSPRGRITLMRALETGRLDEDDPTLAEESSFCLGCRACETVCPAGVEYGLLLEQWRDHQWRGRHRPWLARLLMALVSRPWLLRLQGLVRRHARGGGSPAAKPETGPADQPVSLMLGCVERGLYPKVSRAVQQLCPEVTVPPGQGCCGALHAHNGDSRTGAELAEALGERLPGTVLTTAGGCAAHLAHHLGRDRVEELSEYLDRDGRRPTGQVTVDGRRARATLQDSCHLRNGLGVSRPPRDLIAEVADFVELPGADRCCGAAGTYSMLRPSDSRAVLDPKLEDLDRLDVDFIVAVNPGCLRQLQQSLRRRRSRVRAVHLAEFLAMASGPGTGGGTGSREL
ncbi:(Fe-S)-binding protein [Streptomyces sp. SBST2-5]|uniref:Glycolate oxidase iron-sulfur subunit n=1 Tax=Streptomyces composti TaxID=2720025 RepID=A0ABX1A587_9ACTN|nr:(Fe-S)-binding protein [Streptomyces composti]NJP50167.1 (Fe-S)-binding protein [Streptomyces composti]